MLTNQGIPDDQRRSRFHFDPLMIFALAAMPVGVIGSIIGLAIGKRYVYAPFQIVGLIGVSIFVRKFFLSD